jgi:hypothetical protein
MKQWLLKKLWPVRADLISACNVAEGTHLNGCITKQVDAALDYRHLCVKFGSDSGHVAVTAANTDRPLGFVDDEPEAAEDYTNVQVLGQKAGTVLGRSGAAIAAGNELVCTAAGAVIPMPTGAGSYYMIGTAMTAASAAGEDVEIAHCQPVLRVVTQ